MHKYQQGFKTFGAQNLNQSQDVSLSLFDSDNPATRKLEEHTHIQARVRRQKLLVGESLFVSTSSNEVSKRSIVKIRFRALENMHTGADLGFLFDQQTSIDYSISANSFEVSPDDRKPNLNFKEKRVDER